MTISDLINMCQARLARIGTLRVSAVQLGDSEQVASLDAQRDQTQETLNQLRTLQPSAS